jgi:DNA-binding CsgD family transcriptional regulator/tetratricopeptide (TPR) repeat protein
VSLVAPAAASAEGRSRSLGGPISLAPVLTGRVGLSPVMVGRAALVERLVGLLDATEVRCSDMPAVALVSGEAGIGKTRLLREAFSTLGPDITVLTAQAEPGSLGRPREVARQLVPPGTADTVDAAVEALAAIVSEGRTALVIEDLHWIDADSAEVIDRIARQPFPQLVVVATLRAGDLVRGAPGGDLVLRLERRNEVDQFRLDRLDRVEVGAMMAAITERPVSSAAVEVVFRRSAGVPFVVEELVRWAGPDVCSLDIAEAQLPWSLEEAVRQQVAGLAAEERGIVEALAVYGEPAAFEVLAGIVDLDERELVQRLRALIERGVVVESREDRLWFVHALVADSVAGQLLGRERRRLHERCLDVLQQSTDPDTAAMARHARGAGRFDDVASIARAGAGRYLGAGASFQALRLACEGLAEEPHDPELLSVATRAAWRLDFLPEALAHAQQWLDFTHDEHDRIEALRYVTRLHLEVGEHDACERTLAQLVGIAESDDQELGLQAHAEAAVAQIRMMQMRNDEAIAWADRAIEHARAVGDDGVVASALVERSSALSHGGDRDVALVAMEEAIAAALAVDDDVLVSRAITNSIGLLPPHGAQARDLRRRLRVAVQASGLDKLGTYGALWWGAMDAHAVGDQLAFRRLLESVSSMPPTPLGHDEGFLLQHAWLAGEEGRVDRSRSLLTGHVPTKEHCEHSRVQLQLAALERDEVEGRRWFEQLLSDAPPPDDWWTTDLIVDVAAAALTIGIPPDEIEGRLIDGWLAGHPSRVRLSVLVRPMLDAADGRPADAVVGFADVLPGIDDVATRPVVSSLHLAHAGALLAAGHRNEALESARRAVAGLERWPGWRRDRAEAMVRRLEGSASRAEGDLTARELEVAALLAEGLTNGQVAERLFISPKTAAVHVSNILAKLGLSSRAEIAAWAVRRGIPVAAR